MNKLDESRQIGSRHFVSAASILCGCIYVALLNKRRRERIQARSLPSPKFCVRDQKITAALDALVFIIEVVVNFIGRSAGAIIQTVARSAIATCCELFACKLFLRSSFVSSSMSSSSSPRSSLRCDHRLVIVHAPAPSSSSIFSSSSGPSASRDPRQARHHLLPIPPRVERHSQGM